MGEGSAKHLAWVKPGLGWRLSCTPLSGTAMKRCGRWVGPSDQGTGPRVFPVDGTSTHPIAIRAVGWSAPSYTHSPAALAQAAFHGGKLRPQLLAERVMTAQA